MKTLCFFGLIALVAHVIAAPAPSGEVEKLQPVAEYISVSDIVEIAKNLKEVVDDLKEKLLNSEEDIRNKLVEILFAIRLAVVNKLARVLSPIVKAALAKVLEAVDETIAKAKAEAEAGIQEGKALLVHLLEKIMQKLAELKDQLIPGVTPYGLGDSVKGILAQIKDFIEKNKSKGKQWLLGKIREMLLKWMQDNDIYSSFGDVENYGSIRRNLLDESVSQLKIALSRVLRKGLDKLEDLISQSLQKLAWIQDMIDHKSNGSIKKKLLDESVIQVAHALFGALGAGDDSLEELLAHSLAKLLWIQDMGLKVM